MYKGETASNAYTRGLERGDLLRKKHKDSVLHNHTISRHSDTPTVPKYIMRVTDVYGGDATKRQVAEAVKIESTPTVN